MRIIKNLMLMLFMLMLLVAHAEEKPPNPLTALEKQALLARINLTQQKIDSAANAINAKLAQMQKANHELQQRLSQLQLSVQQARQQLVEMQQKQHSARHHLYIQLGIGLLLVGFLLAIWIAISVKSNKPKPPSTKQAALAESALSEPALAEKEEYDFMNSEEALPVKLDLARAYIAMQDYAQAKLVLQEIIANGNAEETQEAAMLLKQCSPSKP